MSPTESELRSYLQHEAEQIDASGDHAAAVFAAKRRSDRRRGAGVAAVAVLAMAVPVAWSVGGRAPVTPATTPAPSLSTSETSASSTTAPTASASTATPTSAPTVTVLAKDAAVTARPTLSDAGSDADPGVPYSARGVVHDGNASIETPLKGGFPTFARLDHGGYVLQATSGSDQKVYIVSADGVATVLAGARGFVVSHDRSRIAWTDGRAVNHAGEGLVHIADSRGKELSTVQVDGAPSALVGDTLFVIKQFGYDYGGTSWRIDLGTGRRTEIKGNVYAVHGASGLAIATDQIPPEPDPSNPADSCYRIVDVRAAEPVTRLEACGDFLPEAFSPDGRYVVGRAGQDVLVVADTTTGEVVLDALGTSGLHGEGARMTDDGSAIVMPVTSADWTRSGLVRCELTGECAQVAGPAVKEPAAEDTVSPRTAYGVSEN
jgi:hypothetical protein